MKPNVSPETDHAAIKRILAAEEELIPSSGFLAATMERVRDEAAMPKPIPFPWLRALPGIVLAVAVLGRCGFELVRTGMRSARETSFVQLHIDAVNAQCTGNGWMGGGCACLFHVLVAFCAADGREVGFALGPATGFERGHVLVLVHEEELAVAQALGFAGLA